MGDACPRCLHAVTPPVELLTIGILGFFLIGLRPRVPRIVYARVLAAHLLFGFEAIVDSVEEQLGLDRNRPVDKDASISCARSWVCWCQSLPNLTRHAIRSWGKAA